MKVDFEDSYVRAMCELSDITQRWEELGFDTDGCISALITSISKYLVLNGASDKSVINVLDSIVRIFEAAKFSRREQENERYIRYD